MVDRMSRRGFMQSAGAVAASSAVSLGPAGASRASQSAQQRVTIGIMGSRIRGKRLAQLFAQLGSVDIAYVCDVDQDVLAACVRVVEERQSRTPKTVTDFRRMLDDPSIDGIVVAAPDHWHAVATMLACDAGKHVYCEKPVSHNIHEGRQMVDAAQKCRRVVQTGTMRRSSKSLQAMVAFLQSGKIGPLHFARSWIVSRRPSIGRAKDQATAPPKVDYPMWLGPAPMRPFNRNHFHYNWHWFWEYGTGELGNNGIHGLDLARWGLGVKQPESVVSCGGKHFFDDDQVTPDTQVVCYEYPDLTLMWEHRTWSPHGIGGASFGVEFHGEEGVVTTDGKGWTVTRYGEQAVPGDVAATPYEPAHQQNWLDCIHSGSIPTSDIEIGHDSAVLCHLGNISQRLGRRLSWNSADERFPDADDDANSLLRREYRRPWVLPKVSVEG